MRFSSNKSIEIEDLTYIASGINGDTYTYDRKVYDAEDNEITAYTVTGEYVIIPTEITEKERWIANQDGAHLLLLNEED